MLIYLLYVWHFFLLYTRPSHWLPLASALGNCMMTMKSSGFKRFSQINKKINKNNPDLVRF